MKTLFNEEYFKTKNYKNYLDKKERYYKTASEVYDLLEKFSMISYDSNIIDYGCSVGFLIKGLEKVGCKNVCGYDISDWAADEARKLGCNILNEPKGNYELGFFLDVLEHMTDEQIIKLFCDLEIDMIIARIPCAVNSDPSQFYLEVSRIDETHINCKTDTAWLEFFTRLGYAKQFRLNFSTIYDSDGCLCCLLMK
jgi:SAM-dependent methyltransferase